MALDTNTFWYIMPLVSVTIAVTTGLWRSVNSKFKALNATLEAHVNWEMGHNDKLSNTLIDLKTALVTLQAEKGLFATAAQLNNTEKDLREEIVETRHILRNEMQISITKVENRISEIDRKIK